MVIERIDFPVPCAIVYPLAGQHAAVDGGTRRVPPARFGTAPDPGAWHIAQRQVQIRPRHLFQFFDRGERLAGNSRTTNATMFGDSVDQARSGARGSAWRSADEREREIAAVERFRLRAKPGGRQPLCAHTLRLAVPPEAGKPHDRSAIADQRFRHFMLRLDGGPVSLVFAEQMPAPHASGKSTQGSPPEIWPRPKPASSGAAVYHRQAVQTCRASGERRFAGSALQLGNSAIRPCIDAKRAESTNHRGERRSAQSGSLVHDREVTVFALRSAAHSQGRLRARPGGRRDARAGRTVCVSIEMPRVLERGARPRPRGWSRCCECPGKRPSPGAVPRQSGPRRRRRSPGAARSRHNLRIRGW